MFDFDLTTGTYLHFENAERIYGVPAAKIISDTKWFGTLSPQKSLTAMIDYFYHLGDSGIVSAAFLHLMQDKQIHYIARSKRADGTFIWTQVHIALIMDENGAPIRRVGILLNIDSLKRHADIMAQSEQLFRITNTASGGAVFDLDLATGTYLHFENAERIYGVPAEKIISDTKWFGTLSSQKAVDAMISYFYHPDDAYIVSEAFKMLPQKHSITYVARSRRTDGHYIWSRLHIALIFDENGAPVRRVGRIGGDEFIVFAIGMKNKADILEKADQLCSLFRQAYVGPNRDYKISCSVGIAISSNNDNFKNLFKKADTALYRAKTSGKDCYCLYDE